MEVEGSVRSARITSGALEGKIVSVGDMVKYKEYVGTRNDFVVTVNLILQAPDEPSVDFYVFFNGGSAGKHEDC